MKNKILYAAAFIFLLSHVAFSQIEEFDPSILNQPSEKDKKEHKILNKDSLLCDVGYPTILDNLKCEHPNLIGHQIYCKNDSTEIFDEQINKNKIVPLLMVSMDSTANELKIVKNFKRQYYTITDVLFLPEEIDTLKTKLINCPNFITDTIKYSKRGNYIFVKDDVFKILDFSKTIYVIQDNKGISYYVNESGDRDYYYKRSLANSIRFLKTHSFLWGDIIIGTNIFLSDFISVTSYNFIKSTFESKEVVTEDNFFNRINKNVPATIYSIDKVAVDNGKIIYVYTNKTDGKKKVRGKSSDGIAINKKKRENVELYSLDNFMLLSDAEHVLKAETDRLLAEQQKKKRMEQEREKLEQKKKEQELAKKKQEEAEKERMRKERAAREQERRISLIKKYGEKVGSKIADGKVFIGMTKEQLIESKGNPCDKSSKTNSSGRYEIWTYGCLEVAVFGFGDYYYVHLANDKVVQIDE